MTRTREAIRKRGLLLHDAFLKFDYSRTGMLTLDEVATSPDLARPRPISPALLPDLARSRRGRSLLRPPLLHPLAAQVYGAFEWLKIPVTPQEVLFFVRSVSREDHVRCLPPPPRRAPAPLLLTAALWCSPRDTCLVLR